MSQPCCAPTVNNGNKTKPVLPANDLTNYSPKGFGARISYECNIGCSHCYNQSLPGTNIKLDEERLLEVVAEGKECGFNNVGLTGGEALMHASTVFNTFRTARDVGYKGAFSLMSNGFWGKTEKSAQSIVEKLKESGFSAPPDRINLSSGEYHQEWVPLSNIKNIVSAYYETFKAPIILDFEFAKGNDALLQKLLDYFAQFKIPREAYTLNLRKNIALLGRGRGLSVGTNPPSPIEKYGTCKGIGRFIMQPDAKVVPCCGFNRYNRGIILGDVYKSSVAEIIEDAKRNIAYQYLMHKPMHEIHRIVSRKFKLKSCYTSGSMCEPCEDIFGKEEHVRYLESVAHAELNKLLHPESREGTGEHFKNIETNLINYRRKSAAPSPVEAPKQAAQNEEKSHEGDTMLPEIEKKEIAVEARPEVKPSMNIDLESMSVAELNKLIAQARKIYQKKITEERELRIRQIQQIAKDYKIDLTELCEATVEQKKTVEVKSENGEEKAVTSASSEKAATVKKKKSSPAKKAKSKVKTTSAKSKAA